LDPVKLNLATFKYYDKRVASIALVMIVVFLGGLSSYNVTKAMQDKRDILNYEAKIKRLETSLAKSKKARETVRKKLKGEEMRAIREGTTLVNRIIARNVFPWDRVLDALEVSIPKGIFLESLTPSKNFSSVQIKGVAGSPDQIDLLLSRLKKAKLFERNLLTKLNLQEIGGNGAETSDRNGVRFEIESKVNIEKLFTVEGYEGQVKMLKGAL
jgi:Tfp pilus assembly protein PilN